MSEINVQIVKLEPMRIISAYGFGPQPEDIAWKKMFDFVEKHNLFKDGGFPDTFGFNNPNPSKGSPNYGYEIWLPVDKEVQPEGDLRILDFQGGLYAVTRFKDLKNIGDVWGQLVQWQQASKYQHGSHQWLEHLLEGAGGQPEDFVFDLYLPIVEVD